MPMLWCLMPNKAEETYMRLFKLIQDLLNQANLALNAAYVMVDFERASRNAFQQVFGVQIRIQCCHFHFSQCIWKAVQHHGFAAVYRQHRVVSNWVRSIIGMAYLPEAEIQGMWQQLLLIKPGSVPDRFCGYITNTWVGNFPALPRFSTSLWCVHPQVANGELRCNNHAEGYNSRLKEFGLHPNPWLFIQKVMGEVRYFRFLRIQIEGGVAGPARKTTKQIAREDSVQRLTVQYARHGITREQLCRQIGYATFKDTL